MTNAALKVDDVSVVYSNGFRALDGVSLSVECGEIVALLGASGSGKTTLLRAIEGLEPLESGTVTMFGRNMAGVPTHRRPCTLVFQDAQLFPHRSVGGNIAFALPRRRDVRSEVDYWLDVVDLPGFAHRDVATLSGGQAQRVALARALARRTGLILCDEPLSSLDTDLRVALSRDVRSIVKNCGSSAVYVTHDEAEAERVADRVLRLADLMRRREHQ